MALAPIDDRFSDILGGEVWVAWAALAAIIVVSAAAIYVRQRTRKVA